MPVIAYMDFLFLLPYIQSKNCWSHSKILYKLVQHINKLIVTFKNFKLKPNKKLTF